MRILTLILLPWVIYGLLSWTSWWGTGINIGIAFAIESVYFIALYILEGLFYDPAREPETVQERAKRVIG